MVQRNIPIDEKKEEDIMKVILLVSKTDVHKGKHFHSSDFKEVILYTWYKFVNFDNLV